MNKNWFIPTLLIGVLCLVIIGCDKPSLAIETEIPDSKVAVGDTYEMVIEKLGSPKGTMQAGSNKHLTYPSMTLILHDNIVSRITEKASRAPSEDLPDMAPPKQDVARNERLAAIIEARLSEQLSLYDQLCEEEQALITRLREIGPHVASSRDNAEYYEVRHASAKQSRQDWQRWRRRYDVYCGYRRGSSAREKTYKKLARDRRAEQISLEDEAFDIRRRLDSIRIQKARIEAATRPDLEAIAKLRST